MIKLTSRVKVIRVHSSSVRWSRVRLFLFWNVPARPDHKILIGTVPDANILFYADNICFNIFLWKWTFILKDYCGGTVRITGSPVKVHACQASGDFSYSLIRYPDLRRVPTVTKYNLQCRIGRWMTESEWPNLEGFSNWCQSDGTLSQSNRCFENISQSEARLKASI